MKSFVDYLGAGLELSVTFAIDCTDSNGHPEDTDSLHYIGSVSPYEKVVRSVGETILPYGSDVLITGMGMKCHMISQLMMVSMELVSNMLLCNTKTFTSMMIFLVQLFSLQSFNLRLQRHHLFQTRTNTTY